MQQLAKYIGNYSSRLESYLDKYFEKKLKEASDINLKLSDLYAYLHKYILGGKKIRGALVEIGFEMYSTKANSAITSVSSAIEILHSGLLIQDDWIDRDSSRRNLESAHLKFNPEIAVVLGDLAYFEAFKIISGSDFEDFKKVKALTLLSKYLSNTGLGEVLDILGDNPNIVNIYKTAHYSFVMPLSIGAVLASATESDLEMLKKYGEAVGLAFQIRDDILNIVGDPAVTGKNILSDITSRKKTFIWNFAVSKKAFDLVHDTPEEIKQKFIECGAIDYAQKKAAEYAETAKRFVTNPLLAELADFVITRNK
jgi:geranylgeranyl pyrophosphate synthase